ncbi:MAG: cupin domain-containing protein [Chloroflexota bacterium]|nr:cupin domain-containing protein [Chloroflexota bacterium]
MPFTHLDSVEPEEIIAGFHGKLIHTDNLTISFWQIEAGATLPGHNHQHEQVTAVLEGRLQFVLDGEERVLEPGAVAVIPGGVFHSAQALTDCRVVDVFQPARSDYPGQFHRTEAAAD